MIENLLYEHLQDCNDLAPYLAVYDGGMAIFGQEAPADTGPLWEKGSQYGKIVFSVSMSDDPERTLEGTLALDIISEKGKYPPEEIESVLKPLIDGYFFSEDGMTVSARWAASDYFTTPDENITGITMTFGLVAYPAQTTAEPDPVRLVNKWSYEELPAILGQELFVIGYGEQELPAVFRPSKEKPALYWRNTSTKKCGWIPDTWNCIWQTAMLQCHILTPDPEDAGHIAGIMDMELTRKGRLIFESRSPLFIDRNNRITLITDPHRSGQLSIEASYGILRREPQGKLEHISVTQKPDGKGKENQKMAREPKTASAAEKQAEKTADKEEKQTQALEEPVETCETNYQIAELVEASEKLFHARPVLVRAALKAGGQKEYTKELAVKTVESFMKKSVGNTQKEGK